MCMNRAIFLFVLFFSYSDSFKIIENQDFIEIKNRGGKTLGYNPESGV